MKLRQPFPLADDFTPVEEEPFELRHSTPLPVGTYPPMTMPQRMYALEQRSAAQGKDIKAILRKLSWRQTVKTVGYPIVSAGATAAAAHYPQLKPILEAVLSFFTGQ